MKIITMEVRTMKAGIEGLIQLIKESFNIDNVKKLRYKKLKFSNIAFFSILIIILVLLSINLINDKPKFMKELFSQLIIFFWSIDRVHHNNISVFSRNFCGFQAQSVKWL